MKKSSIIGIVVIAVAISIIISTQSNASSYVSFGEAKAMAENGSSKKIHVVGELKKNPSGQVIEVYPSENKLSVSFVMLDDNKIEQTVYYNEPMPSDFLRSEKVVVIGGYVKDKFVANKILLKCPSKYEETAL
ncbi:MAG: cytochrome c-type biogenesis protein CcmE [Roseivirga sp.]|jgi:cytochrome c-type biogenesis protein CcmE